MARMKNANPKIYIMMGLPGSGKTTKTKEIEKEHKRGEVRVINIDAGCGYPKRKYKDAEEIVSYNLNVGYPFDFVIFDGLILTNAEVIDLIKAISDTSKYDYNGHKYEIHYWQEDRDACLHNDRGRRQEASTNTIKNAIFEEIDVDRIERETNVKVNVVKHFVVRKPNWEVWADENIGYHYLSDEKKYLDSDSWSLGGTYGSCWGDGLSTSYPDTPPRDFTLFDELLERICPDITFMQYKKIYRECVEVKEYSQGDYYGGCVNYAYFSCDLEQLYYMLEEMELIAEE